MRCVEEIQSLKIELEISRNNTKTEKLVNTTLEDKFREIKKDYNTSLELNASLKEQIDDGLKIFKLYKIQSEEAITSLKSNVDKLSIGIVAHDENNQRNLKLTF